MERVGPPNHTDQYFDGPWAKGFLRLRRSDADGKDLHHAHSSFSIVAVFAAGLAFADRAAQTTTYVDGNVTGVAPKTGGTLLFCRRSDHELPHRSDECQPCPYANISHAELGAVVETSHSEPLYKFWAHHKHTPEDQYLIVNYANEEGEQKSMTLELAQTAAPDVLSIIQSHAPKAVDLAKLQAANSKKPAPKPDVMKAGPEASGWWGDDVWKTTRNADKWNKPSTAPSTTNPQDQR